MLLFDINDTTQVNLMNVDAIKLMNVDGMLGLAVIINGVPYIVEESRHKSLISAIDTLQKGIGLTQQYHSL
jgi:hypothetical protein